MNNMMYGKIIKGIAGFYYVHVAGDGIYECKAKGAFRKDGIKPLVGDDVSLEAVDKDNHIGSIVEIHHRKSELIRPAVANVDQAVVIFAVSHPEPNLNLLDRCLVIMEAVDIPVVICFNKSDLLDDNFIETMRKTYEPAGYRVLMTSAQMEHGLDELKEVLKGKTSTVAGPSGVGKSSLVNLLTIENSMETGDISEKIGRGKHTTRHSQLLAIDDNTYIMDTPGFSSIFVPDCEALELFKLFPEFMEPSQHCRFTGCAHYKEPDCGVKEAVESGDIAQSRYDNYLQLYQEISSKRKY